MSESAKIVSGFFDQISGGYDESIFRGCPVYEEMMTSMLDHLWLPADGGHRILELGCGTGNLTRLLATALPSARLTVVDIAPEMLEIAREKVGPLASHLTAIQSDFNELAFAEGQFDLVVSSIAIHHLMDADKERLYHRIFQWLAPGGRFRCADQCKTLPGEIGNPQNEARWLELARAKGANEDEIKLWVDHAQTSDHYAPVSSHFRWLADAGFEHIDCYWRKFYWTLYGGQKPFSAAYKH